MCLKKHLKKRINEIMYKKITLATLALSLTGCLFGETRIQKSDSSSTAPDSNSGYRALSSIMKKADYYYHNKGESAATRVDRSTWGATTCGTVQATINARIADCAKVIGAKATWDGTVNGKEGQRLWKLVSRTGDVNSVGRAREVWRDENTGLLWSSLVSGATNNTDVRPNGGPEGVKSTFINWCKASGSNNITNNPTAQPDNYNFCDNARYQNVGTGPAVKAVSACFEDGENFFTTVDPRIDNAGKAGLNLASTPSVAWRLPTKDDYQQAFEDGISNVLQEMGPNTYNYEWTSTVIFGAREYAWHFDPFIATLDIGVRQYKNAVRCVGR
jgi:hypothetical protein